jgi:hypothetical protein
VGVVEGGAEIGFSALVDENNFCPTARLASLKKTKYV